MLSMTLEGTEEVVGSCKEKRIVNGNNGGKLHYQHFVSLSAKCDVIGGLVYPRQKNRASVKTGKAWSALPGESSSYAIARVGEDLDI